MGCTVRFFFPQCCLLNHFWNFLRTRAKVLFLRKLSHWNFGSRPRAFCWQHLTARLSSAVGLGCVSLAPGLTFGTPKQCWRLREVSCRDCLELGGMAYNVMFTVSYFPAGGLRMRRVLRLVETKGEGQSQCTDVMEITRPDDLGNIADLGLTLAEAKELQARVQQEVAAAQARGHAVRRPNCRSCTGRCHVKDYRDHQIATLFGRVTVRLPRFRCVACRAIEAGISWPMNCRSTPELDQLRAHLSALMTCRRRSRADVPRRCWNEPCLSGSLPNGWSRGGLH